MDEVGELPLAVQKTFLRVLQEKCFRPVGGKTEKKSDFRLIAATNQNLDEMVEQGTFRKDLLFRLRSLTIELPPLRERPEDIIDLVRFHTGRLCSFYGIPPKGFSTELLDILAAYSWPGNVRELVQTVDAVLAVAGDDKTLHPKHLPLNIRLEAVCGDVPTVHVVQARRREGSELPDFKTHRETMERQYLQDLLALTGRNIPQACARSGISRSRLYELLSKYELTPLN